jgi:hypothetical protein
MNKDHIEKHIQQKEAELSQIKYIIDEKVKKGDMDLNALFEARNIAHHQLKELTAQLSMLDYENTENYNENITKEMSILHTSFEIRPNANQDDPTKYSSPSRKELKTLKEEYKAAQNLTENAMTEGEVKVQLYKEIEAKLKQDYEKRFKEVTKKMTEEMEKK